MKFNVGDRVVLLLRDLSDIPAGTLGVVTQVHPNQRFAYGVLFDNNEDARGLHEHELGLPTKGENVSYTPIEGDEVIARSKTDKDTVIHGTVLGVFRWGVSVVPTGHEDSHSIRFDSGYEFEKVIPPLKFGPGAVIRYNGHLRFRGETDSWRTDGNSIVGNCDGFYSSANRVGLDEVVVLFAGEGIE